MQLKKLVKNHIFFMRKQSFSVENILIFVYRVFRFYNVSDVQLKNYIKYC
jgi:hypothetical protein